MGPPPVKSTKKLVKAELEARAKFKLSPRGIEAAIIDSINRIDPLEFLAVTSGTFVVYDIIKSVPELSANAYNFIFSETNKSINPFLYIADLIVERMLNKDISPLTPEQMEEFKRMRDTPDFQLFIKSFFISYLAVKHSGQIIAGVGNITGFIAGFLGLKVI